MKRLSKISLYLLGGVVLTIGIVALAYFGLIALVRYNLGPDEQVIATNFDVTKEWKEFEPNPPMKVKKQIQTAYLELDIRRIDEDRTRFLKFDPKMELIDEFGNTYELENNVITHRGKIELIGYSPKEIHDGFTTLPDDRVYKKLRIRSDKSYRVKRMIWSNRNLK